MHPVDDFDQWIRGDFVALNTELEEAYFTDTAPAQAHHGRTGLDRVRRALLRDGGELAGRVAERRSVPDDPGSRYDLLGLVGFYLAACRRHEVDQSESAAETLAPARSLARVLGTSLGVAPRFVFAHQSLYNLSAGGSFRTFTSLDDERTFILSNALSVLAYQRAATALRRIAPMGVSSPMAAYLFRQALSGLDDVLGFSRELSDRLDVDRFFCNIRPYFTPHRVTGETLYRGVNAGDFAAINTIDVLLGLCSPHDSFYQGMLTEKYPYLPPEDQAALRAVATTRNLLDAFLLEAEVGPVAPQLRDNAELFLAVCRRHGAASAFHHNRLVKPFLVEPAKHAPGGAEEDVTASGPPLDTVVDALARLVDLRAARTRPDLSSARPSLDRLRRLID